MIKTTPFEMVFIIRDIMKKWLLLGLSYILVAALAASITFGLCAPSFGVGMTKLQQLEALIQQRFIGEADQKAMEDAAAAAMVDSLGDRWSYYMSAEDYLSYQEQMANAYVGIGITVSTENTEKGFQVLKVESNGPAAEAGICPGDTVVAVDGERVTALGAEEAKNRIRGKSGTFVSLTVQRGGEELSLQVERRSIQTVVASWEMLENGIGLVTINNFDSRCAQETLAAIEAALAEGATALIFDVRFNPGGYKHELVKVLDYLLPEGPLFRSLSYTGKETVDSSDERHLDIPMAVLVNESSYSAAEFFAAALSEYEAAVVVGSRTSGKGYFQNSFALVDGSAVGLSTGKYFTPNGVCLEGVGLTPDEEVALTQEQLTLLYNDALPHEEDLQLQAAIQALTPAA